MSDFRLYLQKDHADKLELVLRNVAKDCGLVNYQIKWLEKELNLYVGATLCTGFNFSLNPLTGAVTAELKPPQDLSSLIETGH